MSPGNDVPRARLSMIIYTGVLVAAHSGGVGGDETQNALNLGVYGGNGRNTAILLGSVDGGITFGPEGKIGGGGSGAYLGAAGRGGCYGNGDVSVGGADKGSTTAAENACGNGESGRDKCFFHMFFWYID